jgi:hypothetical protein
MENNINQHPIDKIVDACVRIQNGRNISSVLAALKLEVLELEEEVNKSLTGEEPGPDGIIGEAIDCLLIIVDLIYQKNPSLSREYISFRVGEKLNKWETKYGHNASK